MSNKNLAIGLVITLVIAIGGYVFPKVASFGGVTNYDDLTLSGTLTSVYTTLTGALTGTSAKFSSTVGVSTSTPTTAVGELSVGGTGTTTIYIGSAGTKGGCIQTTNDAGTLTKIYVTGTTVTAAAGTCK